MHPLLKDGLLKDGLVSVMTSMGFEATFSGRNELNLCCPIEGPPGGQQIQDALRKLPEGSRLEFSYLTGTNPYYAAEAVVNIRGRERRVKSEYTLDDISGEHRATVKVNLSAFEKNPSIVQAVSAMLSLYVRKT
mgnify:CR=1 FL=1